MRHASFLALAALALAAAARAQNEVHHFDGTTETFTRWGILGAPVTDPQIWYQRLPGDQIGGATGIVSTTATLFDFAPASVETVRLAVHADGGGRPGPVIAASGDIVVSGPGFGNEFTVTIDWTGGTGVPVPLPSTPDCAVPANDLWVAVECVDPGALRDGLFIGSSIGTPGEQANRAAPSDYSVHWASGIRGLTYARNTVTGVLVSLGGNSSWWIRLGLADDVLQPFAKNPQRFTGSATADDGLDPNYGHAGIWPDPFAGDLSGVRLGSSLAPGGVAILFHSPATGPARFVPFLNGVACLGLPRVSLAASPLVAPGSSPHSPPPDNVAGLSLAATSEAIFGPHPLPPLPPGYRLRLQAVAVSHGEWRISTLATISLP
jgi:hypothetical protein